MKLLLIALLLLSCVALAEDPMNSDAQFLGILPTDNLTDVTNTSANDAGNISLPDAPVEEETPELPIVYADPDAPDNQKGIFDCGCFKAPEQAEFPRVY